MTRRQRSPSPLIVVLPTPSPSSRHARTTSATTTTSSSSSLSSYLKREQLRQVYAQEEDDTYDESTAYNQTFDRTQEAAFLDKKNKNNRKSLTQWLRVCSPYPTCSSASQFRYCYPIHDFEREQDEDECHVHTEQEDEDKDDEDDSGDGDTGLWNLDASFEIVGLANEQSRVGWSVNDVEPTTTTKIGPEQLAAMPTAQPPPPSQLWTTSNDMVMEMMSSCYPSMTAY